MEPSTFKEEKLQKLEMCEEQRIVQVAGMLCQGEGWLYAIWTHGQEPDATGLY